MSNQKVNFCFLMKIVAHLTINTVSGRKGNYSPKVWALVDYEGQESEGSIKLRTTKRVANAVKALGNNARILAEVKIETGNERRSFGENGDKTEYFETVTQWVITKILKVEEEGTMPESKDDDSNDDSESSDMLPG